MRITDWRGIKAMLNWLRASSPHDDTALAAHKAVTHAPIPMLILDQAGIIQFTSQPDFSVGALIEDHVSPPASALIRQQIETVFQTGQTATFEVEGFRCEPDSWHRLHLTPIQQNDIITGVTLIATDISYTRREERQMQRRMLELQTVMDVSAQVGTILEPHLLLQNVCDLIKDNFNYYHVHIYLMNSRKERLVLAAGTGEPARRMLEVGRSFRMIPEEKGIVVLAARERRGVISRDVQGDPHFLFNPFLPQTRSEMAIPLILGNDLHGVLDIQDTAVDRFTEDDVKLISSLATQMAVAIKNAQLFEAERHQGEIANTLREISFVLNSTLSLNDILDHLLIHVWWVVPYDAANFMFIENGTARIVRAVGYENTPRGANPEGLEIDLATAPNLRRIYEDGSVVIIPDVTKDPDWVEFPDSQWIKSWMGAPIIINREVEGMLVLDSGWVNTYSPAQRDVLLTFASSAAIAIGNARLFEAERRQREMGETLREISLSLTSALGQTELLDRILEAVARVLPYDAAAIWEMDSSGFYHITAMRGYDKLGMRRSQLLRMTFKFEKDPFMDNQIHIIPEIEKEPTWNVYEGFEWIKSWASAPIIIRGNMIGRFALDSVTPGTFKPEHRPILESLTTHISLAVEKSRLYEEVQREREMADTLRDIGVELTSTLNFNDLLRRILTQIRRVINYDVSSIWLERGNGTFRLEVDLGYEGIGLNKSVNELVFTPDDSLLVREMLQTRQPVIVPDTSAEGRWLTIPGTEWIKSWIGAPIIAVGKVVGFVDLSHTQPNFYSENHRSVISTLATQFSIAVENARYYETERSRRQEIEAVQRSSMTLTGLLELHDVLNAIISAIIELTPAQDVHVFLYDAEQDQLQFGAAYYHDQPQTRPFREPRADGLTHKVARTGESYHVEDIQHDQLFATADFVQIGAILGMPLKIGDDVVGVMNISYVHPRPFSEPELRALRMLANQASIAIQNAHLYEEVQREREIAEALQDIGLVLNSSLDQSAVLEAILEQIARVLPYTAASVWLEQGGRMLRMVASVGYRHFNVLEQLTELAYPVDTTPSIIYMRERREPLIISDRDDNHPLWTGFEGDAWIRSWASAPIIVRGEMIGSVNLDHTQSGYYQESHIPILQALGTQISIAVGNARLFEAERRRREEIETVQDSTLSLTTSLELSEVLNAISNAALYLMKGNQVYIFLYNAETDTLTFGTALDLMGRNEQLVAIPRPGGVTHTVAHTGEILAIPDVSQHPLYHNAPSIWFESLKSILSVPLKIGDEVVGVMNVSSNEVRQYTDAELRSFQTLASQASIAIHNARLFQRVQDYAEIMGEEVAKRTAELERERGQLRAILDAMGEGVIYDERLKIKYINKALVDLTGYNEGEWADYLIGQNQETQVGENFLRIWNEIYAHVKATSVWRSETLIRRKDGSTFTASLVSARVIGPDGEIAGVVTIIRDISQEIALQEQKDRFIANASHELRTPLANFKTRLYLLKKRPDKLDKHLDVLDMVADQMSQLVLDLLDVSRFERGVITLQRTPIHLQDLITRVTETQRPEADRKSIHLSTELPPEPITVEADQMRLMQVMTNLIINAINYTQEEGTISVSAAQENGDAIISIHDTGIGIPSEMLPQVFQPFFRAGLGTSKGTGLGLTITKEIVDLHGGTIIVVSEQGKGSTFVVRLPVK